MVGHPERRPPDNPWTARLLATRLTRRELFARAGVGGAMLAMPNLLAACSSDTESSPSTSTEEIETLEWGATGIRALDYAHSFDVQTGVPLAISVESLLTFDNDIQLQPLLAESWSQPDPLSYVFQLRSDVTFWDGTPLVPEDVVYSLERHMDPDVASEMNYLFSRVKSIEVTGPSEVTVRLSKPDPFFGYGQTFTSITPKAFTQELGDKFGRPGGTVTTMGSGPYKITEFRADDLVTLVRNENYRGTPPPVQTINVKMFSDPQTMQLAMRSGEIDGTFQVPVPQVEQWRQIQGTTVQSAPGLNILSLFFNVTVEPWNDINVRRAVAYSLDGEGLVQSVLGGEAQVANAIVPPAQWGALLSEAEVTAFYDELPQYGLDMDEAAAALAQSSVPDGFSAAIQYPTIIPELGKALLSLQANLKEINVELDVNEVTPNQWFADLQAERYPIGVLGYAPDYPDPANYLSVYVPGNQAHYENSEVQSLIEEQEKSTDPAERARIIQDVLRIAVPELAYLPLWWANSVMSISDELQFQPYSPLWYNQVWIQNLSSA
ncbi:MAG: ABC transporter substrate-binding protein [Nocardioidaceae bacterium]|nr:ABC transporter substrate-binding protein [Nocardioidaceae bacterium]